MSARWEIRGGNWSIVEGRLQATAACHCTPGYGYIRSLAVFPVNGGHLRLAYDFWLPNDQVSFRSSSVHLQPNVAVGYDGQDWYGFREQYGCSHDTVAPGRFNLYWPDRQREWISTPLLKQVAYHMEYVCHGANGLEYRLTRPSDGEVLAEDVRSELDCTPPDDVTEVYLLLSAQTHGSWFDNIEVEPLPQP